MTITIDPENYSGQHTRHEGGIIIRTSLSPYDVPQKLEYEYDPAREVLIADFTFINSEPTTTVDLPHGLIAYVGHSTKMLRRVQFNGFHGQYIDAKKMATGLARALRAAVHLGTHPASSQYEVIERILHDTLDLIIKK